jgi:hypothetical protein
LGEATRPAVEVAWYEAGDVGVIRMSLPLEAPVEDAWAAITDPQRLDHWYGDFQRGFRLGGEHCAGLREPVGGSRQSRGLCSAAHASRGDVGRGRS